MRIPAPGERRPKAVATVVVVSSAVGFATVYALGVLTRPGQVLENRALDGSTFLGRPGGLLSLVTTPNIAVALAAILVLGLALRRFRAAGRAAAVVVVATVLSQVLKNGLLGRPDYLGDVAANTLPSGHTVAYASILFALLIVLPPKARTVAAVFASLVLGVVVVQLLAFGWHRASDVVAGLLLVTGVMALAHLVLPDRGTAPVRSGAGTRTLLVLGVLVGVVLVVATVVFAATLALDRSLATTHALLLASEVVCLAAVSLGVLTVLWVQRSAAPRTPVRPPLASRGV
jgi:hypothetical protein